MRFWPLLRSVVGAPAYMLPLAALKGKTPSTRTPEIPFGGYKGSGSNTRLHPLPLRR
jgi:hypothetical protein